MKVLPWLITILALCAGVIIALQSANRSDIQRISDANAANEVAVEKLRRDFDEFRKEQSAGLIDLQKLLEGIRNGRKTHR